MEPRALPSSPALPAARTYMKTTLTLQQRLLLITRRKEKLSVDVLAERYGVTERAVRKLSPDRKTFGGRRVPECPTASTQRDHRGSRWWTPSCISGLPKLKGRAAPRCPSRC